MGKAQGTDMHSKPRAKKKKEPLGGSIGYAKDAIPAPKNSFGAPSGPQDALGVRSKAFKDGLIIVGLTLNYISKRTVFTNVSKGFFIYCTINCTIFKRLLKAKKCGFEGRGVLECSTWNIFPVGKRERG